MQAQSKTKLVFMLILKRAMPLILILSPVCATVFRPKIALVLMP